ncbi:hypothetical protein GN241_13040 [Rhodobacteraceae bacterium IMCC1335]
MEINPNYFGSFVLFYFYLCSVANHNTSSRQLLGYSFISIVTVLFTFSRKFIVVSVPWLVGRIHKGNLGAVFFGCLLFVPFIYYYYELFSGFFERMATLIQYLFISGAVQEQSISLRETFVTIGMELIAERPLFGFGLMGFEKNNALGIYSHNTVIEVLVNYGLVGFLLFMMTFLYASVFHGRRAFDTLDLMFFTYNIVFMLGSVVTETALWWFWLGLHFSVKSSRYEN